MDIQAVGVMALTPLLQTRLVFVAVFLHMTRRAGFEDLDNDGMADHGISWGLLGEVAEVFDLVAEVLHFATLEQPRRGCLSLGLKRTVQGL